MADEANDAAEDDDPSEDGDDSLYLTVATCGNDNGSSSSTSSIIIIPPVSSSHSSPSVLASSLGGLASDMDNIGILSDDSGPKLTAYGHSKRKRFPRVLQSDSDFDGSVCADSDCEDPEEIGPKVTCNECKDKVNSIILTH